MRDVHVLARRRRRIGGPVDSFRAGQSAPPCKNHKHNNEFYIRIRSISGGACQVATSGSCNSNRCRGECPYSALQAQLEHAMCRQLTPTWQRDHQRC
jgi:hypothetical protein